MLEVWGGGRGGAGAGFLVCLGWCVAGRGRVGQSYNVVLDVFCVIGFGDFREMGFWKSLILLSFFIQ